MRVDFLFSCARASVDELMFLGNQHVSCKLFAAPFRILFIR